MMQFVLVKCLLVRFALVAILCNFALILHCFSCNSNCKEFAKKCRFTFHIKSTRVDNRTVLTINDQMPGPEIRLCLFDYLIVDVVNSVVDESLMRPFAVSIHWHGLSMLNASHMDGVSMLTQCPINESDTFRYEFRVYQSGTFFYHAHSVEQHLNGIFGALVVLEFAHEYNLIVLYPLLARQFFSHSNRTSTAPIEIEKIVAKKKRKISLSSDAIIKVINAAAIDCPMVVTISKHLIEILKSDGNYVKKTKIRNLLIFPGERIDFSIAKMKNIGHETIWLQVKGFHLCQHLKADEIIENGSSFVPAKKLSNLRIPNFNGCSSFYDSIICSQNLQNDKNLIKFQKEVPSIIYLGFNLPQKVTIFSPFSKQLCNRSDYECINIMNSNTSPKIIEIVLINLNGGKDSGITFHLHGAQAYILGSGGLATNLSLNWVQFIDRLDPFLRNFYTPPLKDTFYLPDQGYVIFRLIATHPGFWLLESRDISKRYEIVFNITVANYNRKNKTDNYNGMHNCFYYQ